MKRCIKKCASLAFWMTLGLIASAFIGSLVGQIYNLLYKNFPDAFPLYNAVFDKEQYVALTHAMAIITVSLTLILTAYIAGRYNNDRFEYIITKTDGFYKIRDILKTYVCIFGIGDVISSVICGTLFTLPIYFIPTQFFSSGSPIAEFLEPMKTLTEALGAVGSPIYASLFLIFSHAITLPLVLKYYRAKWLTGFSEGGI